MRRGRRMLLTVLALALPTAALANSVDFQTGDFLSGTITGTFQTSIMVTEVGKLATITIDTGTLTKLPQMDCPGSTCYDFKGGSVSVSEGGSTVFTDSLEGGLTIKDNNLVTISGTLSPNGMVSQGVFASKLDFSGKNIIAGEADVLFSPVPEPSTLLSLGTGLIGFAGMMRRKLPLRR